MSSAGNALISVFDKTGIEEFALGLHKLGWQIYASGGTYKAITKTDIPTKDISELVGGGAILGHKVVTLSREIAAGLLADTTNKKEMAEMERLSLPVFHMVCQDSYPLEQEIIKEDSTPESVLDQTDIGGPTMLREAAKGRRIVLSVPDQRQQVLEWLQEGRPGEKEFIKGLTARAVYEVARYSMLEAKYWNGRHISGSLATKFMPIKYGENPEQQDAALYSDNRVDVDPLGIDQFKLVQGNKSGFVNITDMDRLLQTITHIAAGFERNFGEVPAIAVGVKHGNACGAAEGQNLVEAVKKMLTGDVRAIFGGLVMVNGIIDKDVARALLNHGTENNKSRFLVGVVGGDATKEALEILGSKKFSVYINPALGNLGEGSLDNTRIIRQIRGGILEQPNYTFVQDLASEHMQHHGKLTNQQKRDLILAWAVGSTSNSNTITLARDGQLIGNGVGQQDRVGASQLALTRTTTEASNLEVNENEIIITIKLDRKKLNGAAAYSDSFFPFPDGPELLAKAGIKAILISSGSIKDKEVIKTLKDKGVSVSMVPDKVGRGFYAH